MFGQSAVTKDSPAYKESKRKFKKRALMGDFTDRKPGSEIDYSHSGYEDRMHQSTFERKSSKKAKRAFYKKTLGANYDKDVKKANMKKGDKIKLKDFLKMHDNFSMEELN